jgi:hypothetical protein
MGVALNRRSQCHRVMPVSSAAFVSGRTRRAASPAHAPRLLARRLRNARRNSQPARRSRWPKCGTASQVPNCRCAPDRGPPRSSARLPNRNDDLARAQPLLIVRLPPHPQPAQSCSGHRLARTSPHRIEPPSPARLFGAPDESTKMRKHQVRPASTYPLRR